LKGGYQGAFGRNREGITQDTRKRTVVLIVVLAVLAFGVGPAAARGGELTTPYRRTGAGHENSIVLPNTHIRCHVVILTHGVTCVILRVTQ
jgi:hypothetical protein